MILRIILCSILFTTIIRREFYVKAAKLDEWREIEMLAEENPYIVALLNFSKDYICTGATISRRTILTSGYCNSLEPIYVAAGVAVISKNYPMNILNVAYTQQHDDYVYFMKYGTRIEPNGTRLHSNIGLVFVTRPVLDLLLPLAQIGSYYASELVQVELTSIGFGRRYYGNIVVLQYQHYDQTPCVNPKWYYCVCGLEIPTSSPTYEIDFGIGAPVVYVKTVVAITATSSDQVLMSSRGRYNIFTVIGPYIPWIEKTEAITLKMRALENEAHHNYDNALFHTVLMLLIIR